MFKGDKLDLDQCLALYCMSERLGYHRVIPNLVLRAQRRLDKIICISRSFLNVGDKTVLGGLYWGEMPVPHPCPESNSLGGELVALLQTLECN